MAIAYIAGRTRSAPACAPPIGQVEFDAIIYRLEGKRADVAFENVPLGDAIEALSAIFGEKLAVEWPVLQKKSIHPATTVTLQRKQATLDEAIGRLCWGGGQKTLDLGYVVRGETVVLTTRADAANDVIVCLYDTKPLEQMVIGRPLTLVERKPAAQPVTNAGVSPASPPFNRAEFSELLSGLLRSTIEPGTWMEDGGRVGQIRQWDGLMIVTHRPLTHVKIARYFERLASVKPGDPIIPATRPTKR